MKLVTHNTYWFQGAPSLWGEEYARAHPDIVTALVDLYNSLSPNILCLQEVPGVKAFERLRAALGMEGTYAPGGGRSVYGGGILWRGMTGSVEDLTCGTIVDGRVFERICLRLDVTLDGAPLTMVDYIWVRRDSVLSASDYGVVSGERFRLQAQPAVALSDHHPVFTSLCSR